MADYFPCFVRHSPSAFLCHYECFSILRLECWSEMSQFPLPFKHLHTGISACTCWNDWLPDTLSLWLLVLNCRKAFCSVLHENIYGWPGERVADVRLAWITGIYIPHMAVLCCTRSRAIHHFTTVNGWACAMSSYSCPVEFPITERPLMSPRYLPSLACSSCLLSILL